MSDARQDLSRLERFSGAMLGLLRLERIMRDLARDTPVARETFAKIISPPPCGYGFQPGNRYGRPREARATDAATCR